MRKQFLLVCLSIAVIVIGYLAYRTALFSKYDNKIKVSNSKPDLSLEKLTGNNNLIVSYVKSFNYGGKCIGFDAIVNDKYYLKVTKLGKVKKELILNKSNEDFTINYEITLFPLDNLQIGQYFSFYDFPFHINEVKYYLDGKEFKKIDNHFTEIVFKGNYINFSFNSSNKKDFGYLTPAEEMSVSLVKYKNELYSINTKKYKENPFKDLHSILKEN